MAAPVPTRVTTAPELEQFAARSRSVVAAMRDGHDDAAQALAMNVVDATLRATLFEDVPAFRFYMPMVSKIKDTRD
ncbi:hypothetical protein ACGFIY_30530 [Micromonospora chersina]|uniref:hypothetical protein n=1 Tax=Micromonospora chersina TaxID=47854 RepID=UPI0037178880